MADNVRLPVTGTGTADVDAATDDVSGVHYQKIKVVDGTADSTTPMKVNSDGAAWVAGLGFPVTIKVDVTRPADTTAYAVGDCISNSTSAPTSGGFTFSNAARKSGGSIYITDLRIATSADPATRLAGEVFIFDQATTNINDNAAFAVSDAEIKNCVGVIPFSLFDSGNNGYAHVSGLGILATCSGSADLRFLIRTRNAYTPASDEVFSFMLSGFQVD